MPGAAPEGDPPPRQRAQNDGDPKRVASGTRGGLLFNLPAARLHAAGRHAPSVCRSTVCHLPSVRRSIYHLSIIRLSSVTYRSSIYISIDHLSIYTSSSIIYHLLSLACHIYLSSIYHLSIIHLSINHLSIYRLSSLSLSVSLPPSLCLFQS